MRKAVNNRLKEALDSTIGSAWHCFNVEVFTGVYDT